MNYRHAFHAGNHCDVLKHAVLCQILDKLKIKDKPFSVLDTHAGRGVYDFESDQARRGGEYLAGVARICAHAAPPPSLRPYLDAIRRHNPFDGLRWYPGSPLIVQNALRSGDSAKFCELQPDERAALAIAIGKDARTRIFDLDGYLAIRAFLPPVERRGLVLIDPPFEAPGEFDRLAGALADGMKRWATGVYMVWSPIKDQAGYERFRRAIADMRPEKLLEVSLEVAPASPARLTGSVVTIINPPFGLAEAMAEMAPFIAETLATDGGGGWSLRHEEAGRAIVDLSSRL